MITGELSLQEHLEKAWGWSYSCLDSGQHSQSEPKLEMGAILVFALSLLPERPILNFLLIFDRYVHSVLQMGIIRLIQNKLYPKRIQDSENNCKCVWNTFQV